MPATNRLIGFQRGDPPEDPDAEEAAAAIKEYVESVRELLAR